LLRGKKPDMPPALSPFQEAPKVERPSEKPIQEKLA